MSFQYSHLLGSRLKNVLTTLSKNDYIIEKCELSPPTKKNGNGNKRVINIKIKNFQTAKIFWSYENYT